MKGRPGLYEVLSQGGLHGYINVQPAHPICNFIKGAGLQEAA
jgi:hypothetical protein